MAQSLAAVTIHIIFSTQRRIPFLKQEYRASLFAYLSGVARGQSCVVYEIGGLDDHIHILCSLPRTIFLAKLVEHFKTSSSKWLKLQNPELRLFAWQQGYGAFSVSSSQLERVGSYIRNQEIHHQKSDFKTELLSLLQLSKISFDEKYLWD